MVYSVWSVTSGCLLLFRDGLGGQCVEAQCRDVQLGATVRTQKGCSGFFCRKYRAGYFWTKKVRGSCSGSETQRFVMRVWWWGIKSEILKVAVFVLMQDDDVCVWIQFLGTEGKRWVRYTWEKCSKDLGSIHFYLRRNNCGKSKFSSF